jgi:hypothetical protein
MSFSLTQIKESLVGMGHSGTLNKIRNQEALFERVASIFLQKCKPLETIRLGTLSSTVFDDVYNYSLQTDYNSLIDLIPQDDRNNWDLSFRNPAGQFDLEKAIRQKTVSIEGNEGTKIIRINWRTRQPKTLNTMNSLTSNGTWSAVGTASSLVSDEIVKRNGSASVRFNVAVTGDGIDNDDMTAVNLTDEDEIGHIIFDLYIKDSTDLAKVTSITPIIGNNLTTALWTFTAQTLQADGTAFKVGWNEIKAPWSTATETGTVAPATIDSLKFTTTITGAITQLRIDNVRIAIGRAFDIKYYTKFLFKNSSGTYLSRPASDDDNVLVDNDSLPIFLFECLKAMAQQLQGTDGAFDINYAMGELQTLYPTFRSEYPSMRKKSVGNYGSLPRLRR